MNKDIEHNQKGKNNQGAQNDTNHNASSNDYRLVALSNRLIIVSFTY